MAKTVLKRARAPDIFLRTRGGQVPAELEGQDRDPECFHQKSWDAVQFRELCGDLSSPSSRKGNASEFFDGYILGRGPVPLTLRCPLAFPTLDRAPSFVIETSWGRG